MKIIDIPGRSETFSILTGLAGVPLLPFVMVGCFAIDAISDRNERKRLERLAEEHAKRPPHNIPMSQL